MAFDSRHALNSAIKYLAETAQKRAAGGWVHPKEAERQRKDQERQQVAQQKDHARQQQVQQKQIIADKKEREKNLTAFQKGNHPEVPHVVYHGTTGDFSSFDPQMSGSQSRTGMPSGVFSFSDDPSIASSYGMKNEGFWSKEHKENANIMPVHLSLKKPLVIDAGGNSWTAIPFGDDVKDINQIISAARMSGKHDGVIVKNVLDSSVGATKEGIGQNPKTSFFVFNPSQIKSATGNQGTFDPSTPDITKSEGGQILSKQFPTHYMPNVGRQVMADGGMPDDLNKVGLYSKAARVAAALPQKKAKAEQMVAALKDPKRGVKKEELVNAGLMTHEGRVHPNWEGKTVTTDELAQHLQGSLPQVEESVLGGETPEIKELKNKLNQMAENDPQRFKLEQELLFEQTNSPTKYHNYTLPGGENYREVLLKLPQTAEDKFDPNKLEIKRKSFSATQGETDLIYKGEKIGTFDDPPILNQETGRYEPRTDDYWRGIVERRWAGDPSLGIKPFDTKSFKSSHWNEPNVLAHIRMADRTGPNGEKILHVEELQSDWGQKGKKEGFKSDSIDLAPFEKANEEARINAINANRNMIERESNGRFNSLTNVLSSGDNALLERVRSLRSTDPELLAAQNQAVEAERALTEARNKNRSGVPSAPYVTSTEGWTDLALKRVLKEAAEGGYDKIVWTPGDEQAKRYNLSKHIDHLEYHPEIKSLIGVKNNQVIMNKSVEPEKIEDYVGKDVAKNLLAQPIKNYDLSVGGFHALSGQDLSVGGEGMKGYYDKIVPSRLQALAKKHDPQAKIGQYNWSNMNYPNQVQMPSLDVTPQLRQSVLSGQEGYKRGGMVESKHPALMIPGMHIREETHGKPLFTGKRYGN